MHHSPFIETFESLSNFPHLVHGFVLRHPDVDVKTDRDAAMARLRPHYQESLDAMGICEDHVATGEQIHDRRVACCDGDTNPRKHHYADTDGLITATAGQFVGVYVADCGAVLIADPVRRACGAIHSGKKGTELQIAVHAIEQMREKYGSQPEDLQIQIAPCIRPPAYEVDFAQQIAADCHQAGVPLDQIVDCGVCTTSDLERYYSYRVEKGETGRHFAVIGWSQ